MRKIIKRMMILIVVGIVLSGYVFYNLKSNSVYYAKNVNGIDNQYLVLSMAIKNFNKIDINDINELKFDVDGNIAIKNSNGLMLTTGERGYIFSIDDTDYLLDKELNIINATEISTSRSYKSDYNEKKVVETKLKDLLKPIIDNQKKPIINLQWLFNLIYHDKIKS